MPKPLLFPLNPISQASVASLQSGIRPGILSLIQPPFMRQRTRALGGLLAPPQVISRPWNATGPAMIDTPPLVPGVIHRLLPYPPTYFRITGTTKDATGAALGTCVVDLFDTPTDVRLDTTTSDANGAFEFRCAGQPPSAYYLVAYKAGSPDVAGTTVNTLTGA